MSVRDRSNFSPLGDENQEAYDDYLKRTESQVRQGADWRIKRHENNTGLYKIGADLDRAGANQSAPGQVIEGLYTNYSGNKPELFGDVFEISKPALAGSLLGTDEFRATQNYQGRSREGELMGLVDQMQQYGGGAAQLAEAGRAGATAQKNQLARSGLGRSAASSAIDQQTRSDVGAQQASLRTNIYQNSLAQRAGIIQAYQQRDDTLAQQAYQNMQSIVSLALGNAPNIERDPIQDWMYRGMAVNQSINAWNPTT